MMKRNGLFLAILFAVLLILGGCGTNPQSNSDTDAPQNIFEKNPSGGSTTEEEENQEQEGKGEEQEGKLEEETRTNVRHLIVYDDESYKILADSNNSIGSFEEALDETLQGNKSIFELQQIAKETKKAQKSLLQKLENMVVPDEVEELHELYVQICKVRYDAAETVEKYISEGQAGEETNSDELIAYSNKLALQAISVRLEILDKNGFTIENGKRVQKQEETRG
jgi:hypothetical protein